MSRKSTSTPSGNVWIGTHHAPGEDMPAAKASASAPRRTSPVRWSEV